MSLHLSRGTRSGTRKARRRRPILESLEERIQLSTFRVNTTLDTVVVNFKNGRTSTPPYFAAIGDHGRGLPERVEHDHRACGNLHADDSGRNSNAACRRDRRPGREREGHHQGAGFDQHDRQRQRARSRLRDSGRQRDDSETHDRGGAGLRRGGPTEHRGQGHALVGGHRRQHRGVLPEQTARRAVAAVPLEATAAPASTDQRVKGRAFLTRTHRSRSRTVRSRRTWRSAATAATAAWAVLAKERLARREWAAGGQDCVRAGARRHRRAGLGAVFST